MGVTLQTFQKLLTAQPFSPFRLVMSSGKTYEVCHPEMAMLTRTTILVGLDVRNGVPAEFDICSLLHVTAIEPLGVTSSNSSPLDGCSDGGRSRTRSPDPCSASRRCRLAA